MCPDENTLTQFARGGAAELPALEAHLDGCEKCRRAVAAAASEQTLPGQRPTHELSPGQRVGRYEIERELGRGGMGVVYQARDVTLDRRVALKLLHARRDEAAQARLLREAQVMAKLAHPNVVPVFELGEWHADLYLVMELVPGVTLEAWLKRAKHRRGDILGHFLQAGRGLAAAHAAGVVHRDFKPANVLVGLDDRVRVTDFGLSRPGPALELPATTSPVVTRAGAIVGTLAYMAPEQLDGRTADERSDQFSFCVSLVEALGGQRPFKGDTWPELTVSLGEKPRFESGVPASLRAVLRKGLEREPSHRFASMTALLNALERAQKVGWRAVGVTGVAAVMALGFISAARMQPAPAAEQKVAAAPAEDLVPVVVAAVDLAEGTVVTMDMVQQRSMPRMYVTSSIVKPDSAAYVIGQALAVSVQKGDPLLWTQFETSLKVPVLIARQALGKGAVLTSAMVEERRLPVEMATSSVVKADSASAVIGQRLNVPVQKGDTLLWAQFERAPPPRTKPLRAEVVVAPPGSLNRAEVMEVMLAHADELSACTALGRKEGGSEIDLILRWNVSAEGKAYELASSPAELAEDPVTRCLSEVLPTFRFPAREKETRGIDFPLRFNR